MPSPRVALLTASLALVAPWSARAQCHVVNASRYTPAVRTPQQRSWFGDRRTGNDGNNPGPLGRAGITWFGRHSRTGNSVELRFLYETDGLTVHANVSDFFLWDSLTDAPQFGGQLVFADLRRTDGLELAIDPVTEGPLSPRALRMLVTQSMYGDARSHPLTEQPNRSTLTWTAVSGAWTPTSAALDAGRAWYHWHTASWNANPGPNSNTGEFDNGANYELYVPWASLGFSSMPPSGTALRVMALNHDVDDPRDADTQRLSPPPSQRGSLERGPEPDQAWPERANVDDPSTWGTVVLNQASYAPPPTTNPRTVTFDSSEPGFRDVMVGGHSFILDRWTRGGGAAADYRWETCMDTRFGGAEDLIVHAEARPIHLCFFSRVLLRFDVPAKLPTSAVVTSARLELSQFGQDRQEDPDSSFQVINSLVQVHRLEAEWSEPTVTWNTAPYPSENVGVGLVEPGVTSGFVKRTFDVTPMVARAAARGEPLNVALFGADFNANSGKYFAAAERGVGLMDKPRLVVTFGELASGSLPSPSSCTWGVAPGLFALPGSGGPSMLPPTPGPDGGAGGGAAGGGAQSGGGGDAAAGGGGAGADGARGGCGCSTGGAWLLLLVPWWRRRARTG